MNVEEDEPKGKSMTPSPVEGGWIAKTVAILGALAALAAALAQLLQAWPR